jgi:bla regulator protein blaR1
MNLIDKILPRNFIYSIGWTIIHSFWQGALIALLLLAFFTLVKTSSAMKAKVSVVALGLMVMSFLVTFSLEMNYYGDKESSNTTLQTAALNENASSIATINKDENNISSQFDVTGELKNFLIQNISVLTLIWFAGFIFFTLRFIGGFYLTKRLKYTGTSIVPAPWQNRVNSLRYKLKIFRPVRLLESVKVSVPIVIGYAKPVILVPVGMLTGLPEKQVEAIIAHELAHIFRKDYLINIIQSMAEIILFYHPAAWWISHRIRTERENSCDDIAVSVCGDTLTFARALANLEEVKMKNRQFAIAVKNNRSLIGRVKRVIGGNSVDISFSEKTLSLAIIVALFMSATVLASVSFNPVKKVTKDNVIIAVADTSWEKGEYNFVNDNMKVKMKDGKIEELIIGGKEIPKSKFSDYQKMVEDTLKAFNLPGPEVPASPPKLNDMPGPPEKAPKPDTVLNTNMPEPPAIPKLADLPKLPPKAPEPEIAPPNIADLENIPAIPDSNVDIKVLNLELKKELEERERNLKKNQESTEKQQEKLREASEKMKESEMELKEKSREMKEKSNEIKEKNEMFIGSVTKELVGRGIISKGGKYNMELSDKELIINGKVQPEELLKIVLTLYKKYLGKELEGSLNYQTGN